MRHSMDKQYQETTTTPRLEGQQEEVILAESRAASSGGSRNHSGPVWKELKQLEGAEAISRDGAQDKRHGLLLLLTPKCFPLIMLSWKPAYTGTWEIQTTGSNHFQWRIEQWKDKQTKNQHICFEDRI